MELHFPSITISSCAVKWSLIALYAVMMVLSTRYLYNKKRQYEGCDHHCWDCFCWAALMSFVWPVTVPYTWWTSSRKD